MVEPLVNDLLERFKEELNETNCCLIYDQLIKLGKSESALNLVRTLIEINTETAFNTKYFTQISQDTLIDILQMKYLNIDEVDLLIACSKWVDAEVDRKLLEPTIENKQKAFAPLKCLINFTDLNLDKIR